MKCAVVGENSTLAGYDPSHDGVPAGRARGESVRLGLEHLGAGHLVQREVARRVTVAQLVTTRPPPPGDLLQQRNMLLRVPGVQLSGKLPRYRSAQGGASLGRYGNIKPAWVGLLL